MHPNQTEEEETHESAAASSDDNAMRKDTRGNSVWKIVDVGEKQAAGSASGSSLGP